MTDRIPFREKDAIFDDGASKKIVADRLRELDPSAKLWTYGNVDEVDGWIELADDRGRTKLHAFVEIKRRYFDHDKYPTTWLLHHKWLALMLTHYAFGTTTLYMPVFDDGIYWVRATECAHLPITIDGRTDRPDRLDRKPMIQVPISLLRKL